MNTFFTELEILINGNPHILSDEAIEYFYELQNVKSVAAPKEITDKGAKILEYLKTVPNKSMTAKMIGEGMGINARSISGSMRRLVTDGFVDTIGKSPIVYIISEKGKEFDLSKLNFED